MLVVSFTTAYDSSAEGKIMLRLLVGFESSLVLIIGFAKFSQKVCFFYESGFWVLLGWMSF